MQNKIYILIDTYTLNVPGFSTKSYSSYWGFINFKLRDSFIQGGIRV